MLHRGSGARVAKASVVSGRLVLLLAALAVVVSGARPEPPAHDFELYDLADNLYSLERIRGGSGVELVAVDFFSVDCVPCKKAIPEWRALHDRFQSKGLRVVIVAIPMQDDRDVAARRLGRFFERQPVPFPVVFDKYSMVARQYGVADDKGAKLPQAFLVGRDGKLLAQSEGHEKVVRAIEERLGGREAPAGEGQGAKP